MSANRGESLGRLRGAVERGRLGESSITLVHGGIGVGIGIGIGEILASPAN